jgi:hypothetical protein
MLDLAEIRARKKAVTLDVPILVDGEWGARYAEAQDRATKAIPGTTEYVEAANELEKMRAEAGEHMVTFKVKGISVDRYERLVRAHPPTPEQRAEAKREGRNLSWSPDTFPAALVAACCVEPKMSGEDAAALWADDEWTKADLDELFQTALGACIWRPPVTLT